MSDEDLEARVAALEDDVQAIINERETYRKQVLSQRLDALGEARDDARDERAELAAEVEALQDGLRRLQEQVDSLAGLSDDQTTSPKKRALDLRQGLIKQARAADGATVVAMHYQDVKEYLARIGHGEVSDPDAYKAMEWAAGETEKLDDAPAFWVESDKKTLNGRQVKAVCVDLDSLPSTATDTVVSNPTNARTGGDAVRSP